MIHERKETNTNKFCIAFRSLDQSLTFLYHVIILQFPEIPADLNNIEDQPANNQDHAGVGSDIVEPENGQIQVLVITTHCERNY